MKTLTKYDILVVVLNRLYLVLVIGLYIRYGYSSLSISRGNGNRSHIDNFKTFFILYSYLSTSGGAGNLATLLKLNNGKYSYLSTSRGAGNNHRDNNVQFRVLV